MDIAQRSPPALYDRLTAADIGLYRGRTAGRLDSGESINLNAIAIGLGLENVTYDPDQFPGLVYALDDHETTVVAYGTGQFATIDAPDVATARDALVTTTDRLTDLGLLDGSPGAEAVEVPAEAVPTPVTR